MKSFNHFLMEQQPDPEDIVQGLDPTHTKEKSDSIDADFDPVNVGNKEQKRSHLGVNPFRHRDPKEPNVVVIDLNPSYDPTKSLEMKKIKDDGSRKQWVWILDNNRWEGEEDLGFEPVDLKSKGKMKIIKSNTVKESVEGSIETVSIIENLCEEVISEFRGSSAVGMMGLNDLQKARGALQKVLTIISSHREGSPQEQLRGLLDGLGELSKGMIEVTRGHQKVLGTLVYQSSTRK